jgi:hypothetical protein
MFDNREEVIYDDNDYFIYGECQRCRPCNHHVEINGKYQGWLDGFEIYDLFIENNVKPPSHFKYCKKLREQETRKNELNKQLEKSFTDLEYIKKNINNIINLSPTNIKYDVVIPLLEYGTIDVIKYCFEHKPDIFKEIYDIELLNILFNKTLPIKKNNDECSILTHTINYNNLPVIMKLLEIYKSNNDKFDNKEFILLCNNNLLEPVKYMLENNMLINETQAIYKVKSKINKNSEIYKFISEYKKQNIVQNNVAPNPKLNLSKYRNFR